MKIAFYLERIVDYIFISLGAMAISFYLPVVYGFGLSFLFFTICSFLLKKTPAMLLFGRCFSEKPRFGKILKTLLFLGEKDTQAQSVKLARTIIVVSLALCALVGGGWESNMREFSSGFELHQKNAGWEYYISQEKGFTVQLPENPSVETKELYVEEADKTLAYNEYKSVVGQNSYYSVSFMDFPSRWKFVGSNKLLNSAFEIFVKSEENVELVSKDSVQHKVYPAIEFKIKNGNEEWCGRLILVGNTFYKIMRVSSTTTNDDAEFDDFLRSFQFPDRK